MAQTVPNFSAVMRRIIEEELRMPEANPKAGRAVADGKAPLDYLEPVCDAGEARVLKGGADKYGRRNFRDPYTEMLWSTYLGSMRRHLNALHAGEDLDPDSGEHHLSHIRANTAVLQAAMDAGTLRDDRLETTVTARSSAAHKDGNQDAKVDSHVIHYTAADIGAVAPFVVVGRDGQPLSDEPCCIDSIDGICTGPRDPDCCRMETKVEPFVVDARCTEGCTRVNEACAMDGTVEVARPVEPFVVDAACCCGPNYDIGRGCTYFNGDWCRSMRVE